MSLHYLARAARLGALLVALSIAGCFGHAPRKSVSLERRLASLSEGLPEATGELVSLANSLLSEPPDDHLLLRALAASEAAVALSPGYRTRWRAARTAGYVANWHSERDVRVGAAGRGADHARAAVEVSPGRVGGYYFLAQSIGLRIRMEPDAALSGLEEVVRLCEKARDIDPDFQRGGPLRLLGGLYAQAPPWPASVGDIEESEELLLELVEAHPDYPLNHYFLGETLMKLSDYDRASSAFRAVLRARPAGIWRLEGPHFRKLARQRLADIERIRALRSGGM